MAVWLCATISCITFYRRLTSRQTNKEEEEHFHLVLNFLWFQRLWIRVQLWLNPDKCESMSWFPNPYAALFLCCCIVSTGGVFYYDNPMNMKMFEVPGEIKKYESEELMKKLKAFFRLKEPFSQTWTADGLYHTCCCQCSEEPSCFALISYPLQESLRS